MNSRLNGDSGNRKGTERAEINGGEHLALLALLLNKLKATQRHRILLDLSLSKLQVALLEIRIEYLG